MLEILQETSPTNTEHQELRTFAKYIVRRLYDAVATRGPDVVAIETMFNKKKSLCYEYANAPQAFRYEDEVEEVVEEVAEEEAGTSNRKKRSNRSKKGLDAPNISKQRKTSRVEETTEEVLEDFDFFGEIEKEKNRLVQPEEIPDRTWESSELVQLNDLYNEMQSDNPDDVFEVVSGTLLVRGIYVTPGQCYVKLKELGRIVEQDIAKFDALFLAPEERQKEKASRQKSVPKTTRTPSKKGEKHRQQKKAEPVAEPTPPANKKRRSTKKKKETKGKCMFISSFSSNELCRGGY